MIRLGSLAGYPFEGPRALVGWAPPDGAAVYAILCRDDAERRPNDYAVIYVGHSDNLADGALPWRHERTQSWIERAGSKWALHVCTYVVPGGLVSHREQIVRELVATYRPSCNVEQFDQAWNDEWIGSYAAPTTGPLTTGRTPPAAKKRQSPEL